MFQDYIKLVNNEMLERFIIMNGIISIDDCSARKNEQ